MDGGYSGLLESGGLQVSDWLMSEAFEWRLCSFFPCTDIVPPLVLGQVRAPGAQHAQHGFLASCAASWPPVMLRAPSSCEARSYSVTRTYQSPPHEGLYLRHLCVSRKASSAGAG